nr:MBL fold metallo-hydrolase [Ectobacillus ponti]
MSLFLTYYEEAAARSLTVETLEALDRLQVEEPLQDQRILLFLLGKKLEQKDFSPAELAWLRQQPYSWSAVRLYVLDQGLDGLPHLKQSFCHHADLPEAVSYLQQLTQAAAAKEKKDLSPVRITVVGGGEKIGGTSILASVGEHHLLLDAGMHLNDPNRVFPNYQVLHQQGIDFADIDALVVTHAHLDHTGAVPYVHQLHKGLPIYATEETRELMEVLLRDVQRNNRTTPGFYSEQDLQAALHHMQTVSLGSTISIPSKGKEWKVTFYRAGHILGAAAIHLVIDDYSILFTGDYSLDRQRTVSGLQLPPDLSVDVLITESTYGYLPSNAATTREWQEKQLVQLLLDVTEKGGSILIPAFALGRAQELLLIVKEHFKQQRFLPFIVYLDGMVPEICRIYEHYLKDDPLRKENEALFFGGGVQAASQIYRSFSFDEHYDQIMAGGKRVIIASSGMLQEGSASARYAERMLPRPEHALAFTGYIDEESPGYSIHALREQQQRTIALHGKDVDVRARVASFRLSAHASREQIVETVVSLQPQMVLLVHGEHEQSYKPPRAEGRIAVYPTVRQLLGQLPMKVIAAYNGQTYSMISEETQ